MKRPVTDEELDRLLAARLRDHPAGIAERVTARIEAERAAPPRRARRWVWYLLPALAAAGFALMFAPRHDAAVAASDFETLLALDASLAPARPLLDPLNRELCTELPVAPAHD